MLFSQTLNTTVQKPESQSCEINDGDNQIPACRWGRHDGDGGDEDKGPKVCKDGVKAAGMGTLFCPNAALQSMALWMPGDITRKNSVTLTVPSQS